MRRTLLLVLAAACVAGCNRRPDQATGDEPGTDAAIPADTNAAHPGATASNDAALSVHRERSFDITGDGAAERFIVVANGPRYDSLDITLTIATLTGDTLWVDRWNSSHYFKYTPRQELQDTAVERIVRAHVDSLLHDSRFAPGGLPALLRLDATDMNEAITYHLAELDWRNGAGLEARDPTPPQAWGRLDPSRVSRDRVAAVRGEVQDAPTFAYYAGGEATYALAWSAREWALVRVYSCC